MIEQISDQDIGIQPEVEPVITENIHQNIRFFLISDRNSLKNFLKEEKG